MLRILLLRLACFTFLWKILEVRAYDAICEAPHNSIYCSCDSRHRETTVSCFVIRPLSEHDDVWRSLSTVEDVVILKLQAMSAAPLNYIPTESLQGLGSLRIFTMQQANLSELGPYALSGMKTLQELNLASNEITKLHLYAFTNLTSLRLLNLGENLLQEVLANSLVGLWELQKLFLDRNNIERIEACAFCDLQNLRELELWGNSIADLSDYMFRGLRYLTRLDLYMNKIRILNDKVFHSMPRLVEIDLKDNLITHVSPHAFDGLDKLQILNLNSNQIKLLPDQVFKSLPNLRWADLSNNKLETLQEEVVKNIPKIKDEQFSLSLRENPLVCDCRLSWVKHYLKHNKSHIWTKELADLQCRPEGENGTLQTVHLLKLNCHKHPKRKDIITTSRSVTQPVSFVPYEIHGRQIKNKTSDVTREDEYPSHDAESQEKVDEKSEEADVKTSASSGLLGDVNLTMCLILLTIFFVRK